MIEYPPIRLEQKDLSYFDVVDEIVGRSVAAGDPMIALEYVQGLQREGFVKGLAIAKLMYRLKQSWSLFQAAGTDDEFEFVVESVIGYRPATTNKYINLWESVFENPALSDDLKQALAGKPIESLLLVVAAAREGSLEDEDWKHIASSSDIREIRSRIRERRGDVTSSKNARLPSLFRREQGGKAKGTLIITAGGEQKVVGYLNLDTGDRDVDEYINKMINALRILEVF